MSGAVGCSADFLMQVCSGTELYSLGLGLEHVKTQIPPSSLLSYVCLNKLFKASEMVFFVRNGGCRFTTLFVSRFNLIVSKVEALTK